MRRRILITRPEEECHRLQELVGGAGIVIVPFPVLRFEAFEDAEGWRRLAGALEAGTLPGNRWILLASPRSPGRLAEEAQRRGLDRVLHWPAAAVGTGTARRAAGAGLTVRLTGPGTGAGLAEALISGGHARAAYLFACGEDHRPELPQALVRAGAQVLPVIVYRMRPAGPDELPPPEPPIDGVVLTSPRSARTYLERFNGRPLDCPHWAIGPTTTNAAAGLGIACRTPARPELESLAEELCTI
jgi:uroporphyrinogen-III synthase